MLVGDPVQSNTVLASQQLSIIPQAPLVLGNDATTTTAQSISDQKSRRFSVADRLKKLGKELGRLGKSDKDHVASTSNVLSGLPQSVEPSRRPSSSASSGRHTDDSTREACTDYPTTLQFGQGPSPAQDQSDSDPEPTTLAREIQDLVNSLPLPPPTNSNPTLPSSPFPSPTLSHQTFPLSPYPLATPLPTLSPPTQDAPAEPQPQLKDSRLIALLSNASFMNGSSLKGKPSIWSILESIHRTKGDQPPPPSPPPPNNIYTNQALNDSSQSMFSDTSSIMVYSPLFPTQSDFVELAEFVPFDADADSGETEGEMERDVVLGLASESQLVSSIGNLQENQEGTSWTAIWPFSIWYNPNQPTTTTPSLLSVVQSAEPTTSPPPQVSSSNATTNQQLRPVKSHKSIRAWVPSPCKISVQAFWWGYRLYLPPPILSILTDQTLEATSRSAVITTALTWFFTNLPVDVFPPPMKPALILLQRLVPLLGYIGTFISWSWNTIKGYDVGYGVTLTATWILPVALIPGTWYERDFPKSPLPNSPIPLPRPLSASTSFVPTTPATEHDVPTSVYATPMSSVGMLGSPPPPDGVPSLASTSSLSSSSLQLPPLIPQYPPTSSPIHYPTTTTTTTMIPPNSPSTLCFTPNSPTPAITPHPHHLPPSNPTPQASRIINLNLNSSSSPTIPSPRIRTPRFSTHMRSFSSFSSSSSSSSNSTTTHAFSPPPPPLPTPIPIPPTPPELPPIPPDSNSEPPLSPKLVDQLLRGPVLQTVPLPDVG